jgi:hypothetical protein
MTSSHWDTAFTGDHTQRGWYQSSADPSWQLIGDVSLSTPAIDIGGGASVWIDEALDRGWSDLSVLDWSEVALLIARQRLGERAAHVTWIARDLLNWVPDQTYGLWHDRAVLHFLLTDQERDHYARALRAATHLGSVVVIGGFSPSGPQMCAGLPVRRQSLEDFTTLFGDDFTMTEWRDQVHVRPDSDTQDYLWVRATRTRA